MPGFKDRMKAIKEHFKRPTRIKPDPKGCLEAAGPGEHIKPPPLTRPSFKDRVKAAVKPFCLKFQCVKRQKDEDDCPGLPEVKVSFVDKDIPESLASRSCISLTDSESDGCPAEADLGSRSDSLEGIPEMLEAESLPSLMENYDEKEATGKGKDGEKDLGSHDACPVEAEPNPGSSSDSLVQPQVTNAEETIPETLAAESLSSLTDKEAGPCPTEADPGPRSDRVPEPQGRPSDEKPSDQAFDEDAFNSSPTKEHLHLLCKTFPKLSKEERWDFADGIAFNHLDMMLEHFLESKETACDQLMNAVLRSPKGNLDICLNHFIVKLNEYEMEDSKELPLAKVKALSGIKVIVADISDIQDLKQWLKHHLVTLANVLASKFRPKEQDTSSNLKTYLVPGEAIDILAILLQRLDLVHSMKYTLSSV